MIKNNVIFLIKFVISLPKLLCCRGDISRWLVNPELVLLLLGVDCDVEPVKEIKVKLSNNYS